MRLSSSRGRRHVVVATVSMLFALGAAEIIAGYYTFHTQADQTAIGRLARLCGPRAMRLSIGYALDLDAIRRPAE